MSDRPANSDRERDKLIAEYLRLLKLSGAPSPKLMKIAAQLGLSAETVQRDLASRGGKPSGRPAGAADEFDPDAIARWERDLKWRKRAR